MAATVLLATPLAAQQPLTLVEELRIGALDGPASLSAVSSVVASTDGRYLYVAQGREHVIRIFDASTGRLVRTIGGEGGGPGEFRRVGRLTFRNDTLYAADPAQQRIAVFTREGAHVATRRIVSGPLEETGRPAVVLAPTPAGTYWAESLLDAGMVASGALTDFPAVVVSPEGKVLAKVGTQKVAGFMERAEFGGRIAFFMQPLRSPWDRRAYASDGSALVLVSAGEVRGREGEVRVVRISSIGDTLVDRTFRYTPRPVPAEARDSIYGYYAEGPFSGASTPAQAMAEARKHVELPDVQPPVTGVIADPGGATWIRREGLGPAVTWEVLASDGSPSFRVETSSSLEVIEVAGGVVWAVERDELGVPYIVKYRVRDRE